MPFKSSNIILWSGATSFVLGYPLPNSKSVGDFSPSGDLTLCIGTSCFKSLTTNSSNPNAVGS